MILCQTAYLYLGSTSLPAYYVPDARIQAEKWLEQVFFPNVFGIFAIFYNVLCLQIPSYTGKNCQKKILSQFVINPFSMEFPNPNRNTDNIFRYPNLSLFSVGQCQVYNSAKHDLFLFFTLSTFNAFNHCKKC